MKINELSIGDWVLDGTKQAQVTTIMCDGPVETTASPCSWADDLEPIPITEEILEKNFEEKYGEIYGIYENYFDLEIHRFNDGMYILHYHYSEMSIPGTQIVGICWVHELQHALRLCGITKEIEL